jgi:serine protease Do
VSRHPALRPRRRLLLGAAASTTAVALLAGCSGGTPAVSTVEGVKAATMRFTGQGTFLEPLTTVPSEYAWVGTGWFIDADGTAVTNNHVVAGAGTLEVAIGGDNDDSYPATVVAASECYDLAVVMVDVPDPVPFLAWFDGDIVEGAEVYSAGYPAALGEDYTLTKGIVSQADTEASTSWADVTHAIEHDARIRGGNSGGPLVDPKGAVYGVNYAGEDVNDTNAAIGRDDAEGVVAKLRNGEDVLSLGLNIRALAPDEATGAPYGIWVQSVRPGSPADKAGMKAGDVLVSLNGVTMGQGGTVQGYCDVLHTSGLDATMDIEVYRTPTGETLEGQINGRELEVVAGGGQDDPQPTPGGFVDVQSDDGRFVVRVPSTWADLVTAPGGDGSYQFSASTNASAFGGDFSVSGVSMLGYPGSQDITAGLTGFASQLDAACTPVDVRQDYADGAFTGAFSTWSGCGSAETIVISANKDDGSAYVLLYIVLNGTEISDDTVSNIVSTFNVVL